jgi:hypothetical protein
MTAKVNELYYAKDNTPSFYQFKDKYQFIDAQHREYMIAVKNKQILQNDKFKYAPRSNSTTGKIKEPVINNYGYVKLYVKLVVSDTKWFGYKDVGRQLILSNVHTKQQLIVKLQSHEKSSQKRRAGAIWVSGLSRGYVRELLNK